MVGSNCHQHVAIEMRKVNIQERGKFAPPHDFPGKKEKEYNNTVYEMISGKGEVIRNQRMRKKIEKGHEVSLFLIRRSPSLKFWEQPVHVD